MKILGWMITRMLLVRFLMILLGIAIFVATLEAEGGEETRSAPATRRSTATRAAAAATRTTSTSMTLPLSAAEDEAPPRR